MVKELKKNQFVMSEMLLYSMTAFPSIQKFCNHVRNFLINTIPFQVSMLLEGLFSGEGYLFEQSILLYPLTADESFKKLSAYA